MSDSDRPLDTANPYNAVNGCLYDRVRPTYPLASTQAFVAELRCIGGSVLDIACGTGALATKLADAGCQVTGVDIAIGMLLAGRHRGSVVCGSAELLPFKSARFRAASIGQAFHWLQPSRALAEIAHALIPGGRLGLIWNFRDVDTGVERMIDKCVEQYSEPPSSTWRGVESWPDVVESTGPFQFIREESVGWERQRTLDEVVAGVLTRSYVAVLPAERQRIIATELRARLKSRLEIAARYTTSWYVFVREPLK
jgi:ubiquinone/menaquinone biosynthesis C-methylase UbiE